MPNDDTAKPEYDTIVRQLQATERTLQTQRYDLLKVLKQEYVELERQLQALEEQFNTLRDRKHELGGQINKLNHLLTTDTLGQMQARSQEHRRRR